MRLMGIMDAENDYMTSLVKKLSPPLVTLLSAEPEIQYVALRNINLIVQKRYRDDLFDALFTLLAVDGIHRHAVGIHWASSEIYSAVRGIHWVSNGVHLAASGIHKTVETSALSVQFTRLSM